MIYPSISNSHLPPFPCPTVSHCLSICLGYSLACQSFKGYDKALKCYLLISSSPQKAGKPKAHSTRLMWPSVLARVLSFIHNFHLICLFGIGKNFFKNLAWQKSTCLTKAEIDEFGARVIATAEIACRP